MKKPSPTPASIPATTDDIDDSWGDSSLGAPREPSVAPPAGANEVPSTPPGVVSVPEKKPAAWSQSSAFSPTIPVATSAQIGRDSPPANAEVRAAELRRLSPTRPELELVRKQDPLDDLELQIETALEVESPLGWVDSQIDPNARSRKDSSPAPALGEAATTESTTDGEMRDRYAVGDFTGALVIAESILETEPENEDALRYAQSCREVLTQMYAARLGPLDQTVTVAIPAEQITWLSLDHRAGFLLSLVDGVSSVEEILDISGMTRLEALRIMFTLVQQNVISLG